MQPSTASLLFLLLASTVAIPFAPKLPFVTKKGLLSSSVPPSLPTSKLVPPDPSWTLKAIALGLGTQNYTCATATSSSIPKSAGAVAALFDVTALLSSPLVGPPLIPTLPVVALSLAPSPPQSASNFPLNGFGSVVTYLGAHYFNGHGIPSFDLFNARPSPLYLSAAKEGGDVAPKTAFSGREGEGAIDWLYLTANTDPKWSNSGLKAVYRVVTAGGKPPALCEGQKEALFVAYAAEYWFYG